MCARLGPDGLHLRSCTDQTCRAGGRINKLKHRRTHPWRRRTRLKMLLPAFAGSKHPVLLWRPGDCRCGADATSLRPRGLSSHRQAATAVCVRTAAAGGAASLKAVSSRVSAGLHGRVVARPQRLGANRQAPPQCNVQASGGCERIRLAASRRSTESRECPALQTSYEPAGSR